MNTTEMRQRMAELQQELTKDNKTAFEKMALFISASSRTERDKKELLLELLEHLVLAQKDGKSANDIFGDDLEAYCRELISNMTKPALKLKLLDFVFFGLGAVDFFALTQGILNVLFLPFFPEIIGETNLLTVAFLFLITYGMTMSIFYLFKHYVFKENGKLKMILFPLTLSMLVTTIPVFLFAAIDFPAVSIPPIPQWIYVITGVVLITLSFSWIFKLRDA
jgi:DNA-binding ferritin-like protein (Dps family)